MTFKIYSNLYKEMCILNDIFNKANILLNTYNIFNTYTIYSII